MIINIRGMENLTKENLNNQIVSMRRLMKKVKVLTINSLIKKSRKLKKANITKTAQNDPCRKDKKLDRILMEIQEIKKLNADEITKFSLMNVSEFSQVAKTGSCKERALARLAEQTILKNTVSQFRTKYPKWEVQIPSLFHIWEFNKKVMGKNLKEKPKNELSSIKTREIPCKKGVLSKQGKSQRCVGSAHVQALPDEVAEPMQETEVQVRVETNSRQSLKQLSANLKSKQSHDVNKNHGEMEVKRINLDELVSEIPIENTSKSKQSNAVNSDTLKSQHKVMNSFFITSDNDSAPSDEEQEVKESDYDKHSGSSKLQPKKRSTQISRPKSTSFFGGHGDGEKNFKGKSRVIDTLKNGRTQDFPEITQDSRPPPSSQNYRTANTRRSQNIRQSDSPSLAAANLHPSWQAKRKQSNTMLTAFAGKKIHFDDD